MEPGLVRVKNLDQNSARIYNNDTFTTTLPKLPKFKQKLYWRFNIAVEKFYFFDYLVFVFSDQMTFAEEVTAFTEHVTSR